jgi:sulfur relay (sulfurtransferase) DsrC/TusE family protein
MEEEAQKEVYVEKVQAWLEQVQKEEINEVEKYALKHQEIIKQEVVNFYVDYKASNKWSQLTMF